MNPDNIICIMEDGVPTTTNYKVIDPEPPEPSTTVQVDSSFLNEITTPVFEPATDNGWTFEYYDSNNDFIKQDTNPPEPCVIPDGTVKVYFVAQIYNAGSAHSTGGEVEGTEYYYETTDLTNDIIVHKADCTTDDIINPNPPEPPDDDDDADADADADSDSDTDTDADADSDTDTDGDNDNDNDADNDDDQELTEDLDISNLVNGSYWEASIGSDPTVYSDLNGSNSITKLISDLPWDLIIGDNAFQHTDKQSVIINGDEYYPLLWTFDDGNTQDFKYSTNNSTGRKLYVKFSNDYSVAYVYDQVSSSVMTATTYNGNAIVLTCYTEEP